MEEYLHTEKAQEEQMKTDIFEFLDMVRHVPTARVAILGKWRPIK